MPGSSGHFFCPYISVFYFWYVISKHMTKYEKLYHEIAAGIPDSRESKMFGALCIKAPNGKAGVMFWREDMVFKLQGKDEESALALKGAQVFEPADGRQMKGWIHVPNSHSAKWKKFAEMAMANVNKIQVDIKAKPTKAAIKKSAKEVVKKAGK